MDGVTLKYLIEKQGKSLYSLSKESGISYSTLHDIVNGKIPLIKLRVELFAILSKSLGVSMDELYKNEKKRLTKKIPKDFYPWFWDTVPDKISLKDNKNYVICRLLNKGNIEQIKWLLMTYTDEEIKDTALHARDFHPAIANYLKDKFHLKKEDMTFYKMHVDAIWDSFYLKSSGQDRIKLFEQVSFR